MNLPERDFQGVSSFAKKKWKKSPSAKRWRYSRREVFSPNKRIFFIPRKWRVTVRTKYEYCSNVSVCLHRIYVQLFRVTSTTRKNPKIFFFVFQVHSHYFFVQSVKHLSVSVKKFFKTKFLYILKVMRLFGLLPFLLQVHAQTPRCLIIEEAANGWKSLTSPDYPKKFSPHTQCIYR